MAEPLSFRNRTVWMLLWGSAILAVTIYNGWRLCCGDCTLRDLVMIPWTGWLLVGVNLAALAVLVHYKHLNRARSSQLQCKGCHATVQPNWAHCPQCGNHLSN